MGLKSTLSKPFVKYFTTNSVLNAKQAQKKQLEILRSLVDKGRNTWFGEQHTFKFFNRYQDYIFNVPLRTYEDFRIYIDKIKEGKKDVLWPGQPKYFCKTSGTTSGAKYIPLTKESLPFHIGAARNALLHYANQSGNHSIFDGKMIFLQGSPILDETESIPSGRLSGIVYHYVPKVLLSNRLPSYKANCIQDWDQKVDAIVEETLKEDLTVISGIPPWLIMYFEKLIKASDKASVKEIFPNLKVIIHGGVNYLPYKPIIDSLIGEEIDSIETYPASEGFIAYQNDYKDDGLYLNVDAGMFFEFVEPNELSKENPKRIHIKDVELNKQYALIINSNAGLWGYILGDTIKFTSLDPYKIKVTGRIKHYLSAFGEHVIAEEVDATISALQEKFNVLVRECTVAPLISPKKGLPRHQWFIELEDDNSEGNFSTEKFSSFIDEVLTSKNVYYKDLLEGKILQGCEVVLMPKDSFSKYQKQIGKFGGQSKVQRLSNDRTIAIDLLKML